MRIALVAAAVAGVGLATAAQASPAAVSVQISPELQAKGANRYGLRDVVELAAELRKDVQNQLARTGAYRDASVELVLADAVPNRPTVKQLSDTPNLDYHSLSVGGARIEGRVVSADGRVTPVHYQYYSVSIHDVLARSTWADADWTIQRFAYELSRGRPNG